MCKKLFLLVQIVVTSMFLDSAAMSQTLVTENYPPLSMVDPDTGKITGLATDLITELMQRADEKYTMSVYPWSRALLMAQMKSGTCVFSAARTPMREERYKWVGPLVRINFVIFGRSGDKYSPASLDDLRFKVIGAKASDASSEFLAARGYIVDTVSSDADNPRKLMHGRFDYWATGEITGSEVIRQQGLAKEIVPIFSFANLDMYLACNLDMEQYKVDLWNRILIEMEKDGTSATIRKKYLLSTTIKP